MMKMKKKICLLGMTVTVFLGGCNNANVPQATVSVEEHQQDISEQENMEAGVETITQTSQESRLGKMIQTGMEVMPETNDENTSYDLDKKFSEAMDNTGGVTSEMIRVISDYSALLENDMNQYYGLLMGKLDQEGKTMLINEQEAWEMYSNQNNELILYCNSLLYDGGGTGITILEAELEYNKYRERAIELMDLYEILDIINIHQG